MLARLETRLERSPAGRWLLARVSSLESTSIFMMLWCGAVVAHYDSRMFWEKDITYLLAPLLAFVGMVFTRSKLVTLAVLGASLAALWAKMPTPDNHWFYAGLMSLVLMLGVVIQTAKDRDLRPLDNEWIERCAPVLRWMAILLYLLAVFHKLNWHYFDIDRSCAMHFYGAATRTPLMPNLPTDVSDGFRTFMVWGILALELSIPVFLLSRRTWFVGITLGFSFHMLTAAFMRHFPCIMFATYFLFIPRDADGQVSVRDAIPRELDALVRRWTRGWLGFRSFLILQTAGWSLWSVYVWWHKQQIGVKRNHADSGYYEFLRTWGAVMVLGFALLTWLVIRNGWWRQSERRRLLTKAWPLYALPLFFILNSFSPFWGLKTSTSLAMWSNLHTQNGYGNHLLLESETLKIFPYVDDLVSIEKTNFESWNKKLVRRRVLVPFVMLQRSVQRYARKYPNKPLQLHYTRDGVQHRLADATRDPALMEPQSYLFRKVVSLRSVRPSRLGKCVW